MATVLTNVGKALLFNRLRGVGTEPKYSALGTGAGTTAAGNTTLFTEATTRSLGTSSLVTTTTTNDTYQVVATHTIASDITITNVGLFDGATVGTLYIKSDFGASPLPLKAGDTFQLTYQHQLL